MSYYLPHGSPIVNTEFSPKKPDASDPSSFTQRSCKRTLFTLRKRGRLNWLWMSVSCHQNASVNGKKKDGITYSVMTETNALDESVWVSQSEPMGEGRVP